MNPPGTEKQSPKRKVVIVVENLSVPFDRRVWRECLALSEAGYQVTAISPKGIGIDTKKYEVIDGVAIFRYSAYQADGSFVSYLLEFAIALLMSFWRMLEVQLRIGFDVIQICNPPDLLILIAMPFKLLGKRIIFDQHDICPEIYQVQKGQGEQQGSVVKVLLWFEKLTYFFSDVIMVVNDSCKRIATGRGGKLPHDVFVVRNGPSLKSIRNIQPNLAMKNGRKYLLSYVGMMGPQEGIDVLLRAIRELMVEYGRSDFHVRIMGAGTVLDEMKRYANELGLDQVVTFTGRVDYPQVMEGIASADVCLCPDPKTPLSDKCSLVKAVEYMSLGRPFVSFDLEEVHSFAADAAVYAGPNDEKDFAAKVNYLLENEGLRESMGTIGRSRVMKQLTWEHSKEALYSAYDKAFQKAGLVVEAAR